LLDPAIVPSRSDTTRMGASAAEPPAAGWVEARGNRLPPRMRRDVTEEGEGR